MSKQRSTPGLRKRGKTWWIWTDSVRQSCKTSDLLDAERLKAKLLLERRNAELYGERPQRKFELAAAKYIDENSHKRSLERDIQAFKQVMPWIGNRYLQQVHDGTLEPYRRARLRAGVSPGTVNRDIAVVRRVLRLAADKWRDESGLSWLDRPPLLTMVKYKAKKPHVLSFEDQRALLQHMPDHLAEMALFDVNCGARQHEVCTLRWEWELKVNDRSIFVIPEDVTKKAVERVLVLNHIAQSILDGRRGKHPTHVFVYNGKPLNKMLTSAWKRAWIKAGLPTGKLVLKGPHNLRHTFGHRLRAAGVTKEDRKDLLGHINDDITTHYSSAEINHLIEMVDRLCNLDKKRLQTVTSLRALA